MATFSDPTGVIAQQAAALGIPVTDPSVSGAIQSVQQAAISEGLDPNSLETITRVSTLFNSYKQLYGQMTTGTANAAQTALSAARSFVTQNHELTGAINTAQGLVSAFSDAASGKATPQDVAANFAGPAIAAMVAGNVLAPGLGAAIVGGVAIVSQLMDQLGLFGHAPGFQVCDNFSVTTPTPPNFVIGCVAVFDSSGPITPKSVNWRSFPEPKNSADAWWFAAVNNSSPGYVDWRNARWIYDRTALSSDTKMLTNLGTQAYIGGKFLIANQAVTATPILSAFPEYVLVMQYAPTMAMTSEQSSAVKNFNSAFVQAWKANKEFWLNGRSGADDPTVLTHAAEIWNRAHLPGAGIDIAAGAPGLYWSSLIPQVVNSAATDVLSMDGTKLHLNTGAVRTVKPVAAAPAKPAITIHLGSAPAAAPAVAAPSATAAAPVVYVAPPAPPEPAWLQVAPWVPALVGIAAFSTVGLLGPIVGVIGTATWLGLKYKKI